MNLTAGTDLATKQRHNLAVTQIESKLKLETQAQTAKQAGKILAEPVLFQGSTRQRREAASSAHNQQFRPDIGNPDTVLARSKRHRHRHRHHPEDRQQKYERLAFHDSALAKRRQRIKAGS